jgi:multiple sugar transport system ATP-binding protein
MADVTLSSLVKTYPDAAGRTVTAVKGIDLTIKDREFMVLVGPSGCGKSTTLRMIAGLEEISDGTITIDGRVVNDVLPKDRDIAMVFQNYALYPHMSVMRIWRLVSRCGKCRRKRFSVGWATRRHSWD